MFPVFISKSLIVLLNVRFSLCFKMSIGIVRSDILKKALDTGSKTQIMTRFIQLFLYLKTPVGIVRQDIKQIRLKVSECQFKTLR